jgi:hypothetical protein
VQESGEGRALVLEKLTRSTRHTFEQFTNAGLRVVSFRDVPVPPFDVPTCLARSATHSWYDVRSCDFELRASLDPAVFAAEQQGAKGLTGVAFLDLTDKICGEAICPAVQGGLISYRDNNHLTGAFAASLAGYLLIRLSNVPRNRSKNTH